MNAILSLDRSIKSVCTHSSGNHAAALSKAANTLGILSHVIMPHNAPIVKQQSVLQNGGKLTLCQASMISRQETTKIIQQRTKSEFIHSSNDQNVIYGAGSLGIEFMEEYPELDCILAPVGGGGMLSGIALSVLNYNKKIFVIGCEPFNANDAYQSKAKGKLQIPNIYPNTIADGLKSNLGLLTFPIINEYVDKIICVRENEIMNGMEQVFDELQVCIEPSAAVSPAVLLTDAFKAFKRQHNIQNVGVILSGGNVDLSLLDQILCDSVTNPSKLQALR